MYNSIQYELVILEVHFVIYFTMINSYIEIDLQFKVRGS